MEGYYLFEGTTKELNLKAYLDYFILVTMLYSKIMFFMYWISIRML
jgi:hypothetical protein